METQQSTVSPRTAGHVPALDGLRAVAVVAVVAYHQGWPWAHGGFIGVPLFFTLSGFLIAALLDGELRRTGRMAATAYWMRRTRRLLPAALVTVAAVWLTTAFVDLGQPAALRKDALSSLTYLANWRFISSGDTYGATFHAPSPFLHFWSLAIEEQFYFVIGIVFAIFGRRRRLLTGALVALLVAGVARSLSLGAAGDQLRVYYDSLARSPELLVGVLGGLACGGAALRGERRSRAVVRMLDVASLASVVCIGVIAAAYAPTSPALGHGILPALGVLGLVLVVSCGTPGTVAARVLAVEPMPAIGRLSYSIYLVHWPLFIVVDSSRTGLHGITLFAVRMALTLALADLMHRLVERPARTRLRRPRRTLAVLAPASAAVAVFVAVLAPAPTSVIDFAELQRTFVPTAEAASAARDATADDPLQHVAMFGDSTALLTAWGMQLWGIDTGEIAFVGGAAEVGCPFGRGGMVDFDKGPEPVRPSCAWSTTWARNLDAHPDTKVAVVQIGPWEVADRRLEGDTRWRSIGDPVYDRYLLHELLGAMDMFGAHGVPLVWLTSPEIEVGRDAVPPPRTPLPASDPARMHRFNELLREAARERPNVHILDLEALLRTAFPDGEHDWRLRSDGVHFDLEAARREVAPKLVPMLREVLGLPRAPHGGGVPDPRYDGRSFSPS